MPLTVITTNSSLLFSGGTNLLSLLSCSTKVFFSELLSNEADFSRTSQAEIREIIMNKENERRMRIDEILKTLSNTVTLHCE